MRLRGFDEYEITLGDELRGERASLGKTLQDAENDLRIKADVIRAVEDCDLDGFPNDSVVAGYVRSYARYLGLDDDECYRRFCAESGFRSPVSAFGGSGQTAQSGGGISRSMAAAAAGVGLAQSRFASSPSPMRMGARISLGALTSSLALVGLIGGLAYGGYALLQDIQRVGFAPLPEAPDVVAEAPTITAPAEDSVLVRRPDPSAYQADGVLAATLTAQMPMTTLPARDGPISAIDPATSGLFDEPLREASITSPGEPFQLGISAEDEAIFLAAADLPAHLAAKLPKGPPRIFVHATDEAWIRVRDGGEIVVFEGILGAGERFEVPERVTEPTLRAGNAGAVYVLIGETTYGPVGGSGSVIKNMSLQAKDVSSRIPQASAETLASFAGATATASQTAEAVVRP